MAGVPEEYAAWTMPEPPVAIIRSTFFIRTSEISRVGVSIQLMTCSGIPACMAASRMIFAAAMEHFTAWGWGERMIAFLVFRASMIL